MIGDLRRYAAANGRVRTLLAALLGRAGLEALCSYPSPEAVFDALLRTAYSTTLEGTTGRDRALLGRLSLVGEAVLGLLAEREQAFVRCYLARHEVDNLKLLIRAVHHRWPWEHVAPHLIDLAGLATIDPQALAAARDLRELSDGLADSAYGPALRAALHRLGEAGPFALEVAVELDHYDRLWSVAGALRSADTECARRLLGVLFDILNLAWIAHYRDALRLSAEEILNYTLRQGRWVTLDIRRALAEDPGLAWDAALAGTPYAALLTEVPAHGFAAGSAALWRFLASVARRTLTGYPFHIGVPLGFLVAQEIEIRDLQVLLAGRSMGLASAEVVDHLASVRE